MIGSLNGILVWRQAPVVIVECGGVGYELEAPMSTFLELPATGDRVFLHTHLVVREDAQLLFGFATEAEKTLFRTLLKVSGVGAKMALAILSGMSVQSFQRCVLTDDSGTLVKIPGVGRKTAERLIVEMRDRFDRPAGGMPGNGSPVLPEDARGEAVDALVALGYKHAEVRRLLADVDLSGMSAEDIIRLALRQAVA